MKYKEEKLSRDSESDDESPILGPYNNFHKNAMSDKETNSSQGEPFAPDDDDDLPIINLECANEESDEPVITHRRNVPPASIYESLDYDICENTLWKSDYKKRSNKFIFRKDLVRWLIFLFIGIITALIACVIDIVIEELSAVKYSFLSKSVDHNLLYGNLYVPYLYWVVTSIIPVGIGAALVTYIEPVAAGSGIPQVKCYLNGVKVPRIVRIKTLTIKAVGVVTSVVGGLAGGKEGPMIHSGAVVAAGISQGKSTTFIKDFRVFRYFRDDHEKRDFVLGGASAGVASAFGAPIGGVLFSLEEAASFWNQSLIWRILVSSTISSFTLNIVLSAYHGLSDFTFIGLFNLGKFDDLPYQYFELPIFVLMGVCGGLLGALWNALNTKINLFRAHYLRPGWAKVLEAMGISLLGVTIACIMMYVINDCRPLGKDPTDYPVKLFCGDNEYNAVAALWFQTPESTAKSLFHDPPASHRMLTVAVFVVVYYLLSCFTFGLNVSIGIFIPTVLVGAAWGRLVSMILGAIFPNAVAFLNPGKYALIGAAAHMGGVMRMTISLTVILLETTGVTSTFAFPLIITLMTGKLVGDFFNEGIYDIQIRINHVPMLPWDLPPQYHSRQACNIMSSPVICFKLRESAKYIVDVLKNCEHNGFPVVEDLQGDNRSSGRVCGVILRWQLIIILKESLYEEKKRLWKSEVTIETFRNEYPRYPSIGKFKLHTDKHDWTVNFDIFMNPSPIRIGENDSVPRLFRTFRALGLRHMIVVNSDNRVRGIITRKDIIPKED